MDKEEIDFAKIYMEIFNSERGLKKQCYYPGCNEKQINSHILQKNGVLSEIAEKRHVYSPITNKFRSETYVIQKIGINDAYSFPCFCKDHDSSIFISIETNKIDFEKYSTFLLFTIRTALNELHRKTVMVDVFEQMQNHYPHLRSDLQFITYQENQKLGLMDLNKLVGYIWSDYHSETESFIFEYRIMSKLELCTSAFFLHENDWELSKYKMLNGKDKDDVTQIFFNFFPYKDHSILMLGYRKEHTDVAKPFVNQFIKLSEKKVQRLITNRILFQIDTWACSPKLFREKIHRLEYLFGETITYSVNNPFANERKSYDINLYKSSFREQLVQWGKKYVS